METLVEFILHVTCTEGEIVYTECTLEKTNSNIPIPREGDTCKFYFGDGRTMTFTVDRIGHDYTSANFFCVVEIKLKRISIDKGSYEEYITLFKRNGWV